MDISFLIAATTAEPTGVIAVLLSILGTLKSLLYVAVGLGFVIFVHELGHFLVAKACGVKCEKFYIGFDFLEIPIPFTTWKIPRALWKMQIGETEYGVGSLPLGGYVKMLGQDDDPRNMEAEAERTKVITEGTAAEGLQSGVSVEQETAAGLAAHTVPPSDGLTMGVAIEKAGEALTHSHPDPVKNADPPDRPAVAVKTADGRTIMIDPRSYTAKSVPARMAIISAGVVMNAIFAVVFGTVAYYMGVPEIPASFTALTPGNPAWQAGIEPGARIIQFGKNSQPYDKLRYEDLKRNVVFNGVKQDLSILVRNPDGSETWHDVRPELMPGNKFPTIGVTQPNSTKLRVFSPERITKEGIAHLLAKTDVPLENDDRIVAVDGQQVANAAQLTALLMQKPSGNLTLTIEREEKLPKGAKPGDKTPKTTHQVVVEPRPVMETGIVVGMGPITAVRKNSPAESAGLHVGDQIESINGEPVGDPLTLGQRLLPFVGKTVTIVVNRPTKEKPVRKELTATLEAPRNLLPLDYYASYSSSGVDMAAEPLGIAYEVTNVVASVVPGSSAENVGIQPGDRLLSATWKFPHREHPDEFDLKLAKLTEKEKGIDFSKKANQWLKVFGDAQNVKPDSLLEVRFLRDGKPFEETLTLSPSKDHFNEYRGLQLQLDVQIHTAETWNHAFLLGLRETKERIQEVFTVLHRLVTLQLSPTNLSGPPGILNAATQVAADGIPRFLLFLTLLSANLAVINFLPIPVLDGGHMVFLTAEWIRGRPVDAELQYKLTLAGLFFLLSLMVFASAMDVGRFLNL
jgi:regulator of sigma E protease